MVFEYRYAEGKLDRLPGLADELVRLKVDVIIALNTHRCRSRQERYKDYSDRDYDLPIPLRLGWLIAWRGPAETSGFTTITRCWAANDLNCSKKPFQNSPVLQCCGIHRTQAPRRVGKKANYQRENWACNFIPWRYRAPNRYEARFRKQLRARSALSPGCRARWSLLIKD